MVNNESFGTKLKEGNVYFSSKLFLRNSLLTLIPLTVHQNFWNTVAQICSESNSTRHIWRVIFHITCPD